MPVWDDVLSETDRQVFEAAGWGRNAGPGQRPVLMVIDVNYNFVGDRPEPILESITRWRFSCGERGWKGVAATRRAGCASPSSTRQIRAARTASTSASGT